MLTLNLRVLLAFAALTSVPVDTQPANAEQLDGSIILDGTIVLEMNAVVAAKYSKLTDFELPEGSKLVVPATVARRIHNGNVQAELSMILDDGILGDGTPLRMMTLTAIVDSSNVEHHQTPKGTTILVHTPDTNIPIPTVVEKERNQFNIKLNDLKGVKIRIWTLESEIGD